NNIILDKGMYKTEKSFANVLEGLDPSKNYIGTGMEKLDAFERQLKRFDIKINGASSDTVSKFFNNSQAAMLFPEFVKRCVMQGINQSSIIKNIVATNTYINAIDYRSITCKTADNEPKAVLEGAVIPKTEISTKENLIALTKRGRMIVSSYEAIKFQRLDLFAVTLRQIGVYMAKAMLKDAVNVVLTGDGNSNPADVISVTTAKTLAYADLIKLWQSFGDFEMNTMLVSPNVMASILAMPEFKEPVSAVAFEKSNKIITPFGATLYCSTAIPDGKVIALDKSSALEMITAADVLVESDKFIDCQLERATITTINGFAKIFKDASKVLSI
ncbi:MAG: phage major capsid protein, partial [Oscillospiraceae bacterium]